MSADRLHVLPEDECRRLLAEGYTGRLGYVVRGEPRIVPVNYLVVGSAIVFRSGDDEKLDVIRDGGVVALQVDGLDETYHQGWSVLAVGRAAVLRGRELDRARELPLRPWAQGAASL